MTETPNPHIVDADSLTGEMHPIRRVVLGLGSNLGERLAANARSFAQQEFTPEAFRRKLLGFYEAVAQRITDVCLLDTRVEWARVTLHKPDAPIDATYSDVALTITRTRGTAHD